MANTERLKVIQIVRDARNAVDGARLKLKPQSKPRKTLDQLSADLDDLEGTLILHEIKDRVDQLVADSQKLQDQAAKMKASIKKLERVAAKVDLAAKAVKTLVDIVKAGASLGIG